MGFVRMEAATAAHVINHDVTETLRKNAKFIQTLKSGLGYLRSIYRSTDLIRIRYDESYEIGLLEFDSRRQMVVSVYNSLNMELRLLAERSGSGARLNDTAALLVRLIDELFIFEEALMAEMDYPQFVGHKGKHIGFLESLHREFERIQSGHADMHDLSYLIGTWLSEHMVGMDQAFGEFVMGAVSALAQARVRLGASDHVEE